MHKGGPLGVGTTLFGKKSQDMTLKVGKIDLKISKEAFLCHAQTRETHKIEFFAESTSGHEIASVSSSHQGYLKATFTPGREPSGYAHTLFSLSI